MDKQKKYTVIEIKEETDTEPQTQPQLTEDPLDDLPDVSNQTGGLPIVAFVLVCLSACSVFMIGRILTSESVLLSAACVVVIGILIFGMVALIRGMFAKLHHEQKKDSWYLFNTAVMAIGILVGLTIGIFCGF